MRSFADDIILKAKEPIYRKLIGELVYKLTNESERGAVLIGTSKIEEFLEKLIVVILPQKSKTYKAKLLNYPGPMSSFSGKIELLYAFRIIEEKLYRSLNILRRLRNDAAHSAESFDLNEMEEKLDQMHSFEEYFGELSNKIALDSLLRWKKTKLKEILNDKDLSEENRNSLWNELTEELPENPAIKEQHKIWRLSYSLTFMCLKILVLIDDYNPDDNPESV